MLETRLPSWPSIALRDVERVLRHEIDAHPLRADQPDDLLDLLEQRGGASAKSRCASSKKKTSLGLSTSPTSGKVSKSSESSHNSSVE